MVDVKNARRTVLWFSSTLALPHLALLCRLQAFVCECTSCFCTNAVQHVGLRVLNGILLQVVFGCGLPPVVDLQVIPYQEVSLFPSACFRMGSTACKRRPETGGVGR